MRHGTGPRGNASLQPTPAAETTASAAAPSLGTAGCKDRLQRQGVLGEPAGGVRAEVERCTTRLAVIVLRSMCSPAVVCTAWRCSTLNRIHTDTLSDTPRWPRATHTAPPEGMVRCCTGSTTYRHRSVRGALAGRSWRSLWGHCVGAAERSAAEWSHGAAPVGCEPCRAMPSSGPPRLVRYSACRSLHGAKLAWPHRAAPRAQAARRRRGSPRLPLRAAPERTLWAAQRSRLG